MESNGEKRRRLAFKRRKEGVMKKARELSILCDTPVWIVIQSPDDDQVDFWPPPPQDTDSHPRIRNGDDALRRHCKEMMTMMKRGTGRETGKKRPRIDVPDNNAPADEEKCTGSLYDPQNNNDSQPRTRNGDDVLLRQCKEMMTLMKSGTVRETANKRPRIDVPDNNAIATDEERCTDSLYDPENNNDSQRRTRNSDNVLRHCKEMIPVMKSGIGTVRETPKKQPRMDVPDNNASADEGKCTDSLYDPEPAFQLFPSFYSLNFFGPRLVGGT